jgi:serine O-acetyltransferase
MDNALEIQQPSAASAADDAQLSSHSQGSTRLGVKSAGLWMLIREDYRVHGRDWTRPGFRALVMYRFGVWRMGVRSRVLRAPLSLVYRWLHRYIRNHYGIEVHDSATIGRRLLIAHQGAIVIHEHATIGDDCVVRQGVTIGAAARYSTDDAPVLLDRVDVGAGAVIMGKVTIGPDVRIGPNAVVMMDVPAGSTAFAQPARIMQMPRN